MIICQQAYQTYLVNKETQKHNERTEMAVNQST